MKKSTNVVRSAYYVPTIEEFHVGFEFEMLQQAVQFNAKSNETWNPEMSSLEGFIQSEEMWVKRTFELINLQVHLKHFIQLISNNQVRVKCIDKNDCIELGFKYANKNLWMNGYELIFEGRSYIRIEKYIIGDDGKPVEWSYSDTVFAGNVKNKSELKKVLEQCGWLQS